jgi:hypothetical protein
MNTKEVFSSEEKAIYLGLCEHVGSLSIDLSFYQSIFADRALAERLLQLAPAFYNRLQQVLMRDLISQICRLTDPHKTGKYRNLSVKQFLVFEKLIGDKELIDLIKGVDGKTATIRKFRDKFGVHNDLKHCLGVEELEQQPHLGMIKASIPYVAGVINYVEFELGLNHTAFNCAVEPLGDFPKFAEFLREKLPVKKPQ